MQVFIVGSPLETAISLDSRRLNKQIVECFQIIDAINGVSKGWRNHPITKMYTDHTEWLSRYLDVLIMYRNGDLRSAEELSKESELIKPHFITEEYITNMKKRLYTKNKDHYSKWSYLGESKINMYYVNGEWKFYEVK